MTIEQAIDAYHSLFADEVAEETMAILEREMPQRHLTFGDRLICTVLRPHFLTPEQYHTIQQECAVLLSAFQKAHEALLADADFRAQMDLTPDEEEVLAIDPGFDIPSPTARLDSFFSHDGTLHFVEYNAETPAGAGYEDILGELFLELPVMQQFQQQYHVEAVTVRGEVLDTLLDMYHASGGREKPTIGIVDWTGVPTTQEFYIFREYFAQRGYHSVIADPEELEYSGGQLRAGDMPIHIVYKRVLCSELLQKYGTDHPIIHALRDRAVCMVNPFRCKIMHKKMSFAILSDQENAHLYTATEREAIARHIPWTRKVAERFTLYQGRQIDLIPFIVEHKEDFVLKPNDEYGGKGVVIGWESTAEEWAAAVRNALTESSIVQEKVQIAYEVFPTWAGGRLRFEERLVDLDPYLFRGQYVHGCLTRLAATTLLNVTAGGGSIVPTFIVQQRS